MARARNDQAATASSSTRSERNRPGSFTHQTPVPVVTAANGEASGHPPTAPPKDPRVPPAPSPGLCGHRPAPWGVGTVGLCDIFQRFLRAVDRATT